MAMTTAPSLQSLMSTSTNTISQLCSNWVMQSTATLCTGSLTRGVHSIIKLNSNVHCTTMIHIICLYSCMVLLRLHCPFNRLNCLIEAYLSAECCLHQQVSLSAFRMSAMLAPLGFPLFSQTPFSSDHLLGYLYSN